ncbi:MAG: hypothetical protein FWG27_03060 [Treponema sp.]|nr:hypothetical protein [Treponema sp.]
MNNQIQRHFFWGAHSPLSSLTGFVLLIAASSRIAFALICAMALVWVYVFVMTTAKLGGEGFPRWGKNTILLFIASLAAGLFLILLWIFDPLWAMESAFFIFLVPVVFIASGLYDRAEDCDMIDTLALTLAEALILGGLITGMALIREPLGFGSISLPGFEIKRFIRENMQEPLRFFQVSSGALIILGYGAAVYRYFRNRITNSEDD